MLPSSLRLLPKSLLGKRPTARKQSQHLFLYAFGVPPGSDGRWMIQVPKMASTSAVKRNRIKRLLREAIVELSKQEEFFSRKHAYIVKAKQDISSWKKQEVVEDLKKLIERTK